MAIGLWVLYGDFCVVFVLLQRPRWSSRRDQEMLAVKHQIENPPIVSAETELYAPFFRNVSMFRRYEHLNV